MALAPDHAIALPSTPSLATGNLACSADGGTIAYAHHSSVFLCGTSGAASAREVSSSSNCVRVGLF